MEGCRLLAEARELVEREEMREWETRHSRDKKKKKGDVGTEKEKEEEEGERLANFFYAIHQLFVPSVPANVFVPAELPTRYAIEFVPAVAVVTPPVTSSSVVYSATDYSAVSAPAIASSASSSDYSVVSSVNFIPACIETKP